MTRRLNQILFALSLVVLAWLAMQAFHELGHVLGAWWTGGSVLQVVLHPSTISRTDVFPNPHPGVVVWLGPLVGSLLPLALWALSARVHPFTGKCVQFIAGFCLIANGAYIGVGSWEGVGDCGEMLRSGTPLWVMIVFGCTAIFGGLLIWHRLGSVGDFLQNPSSIAWRHTIAVVALTLVVTVVELLCSQR